MIWKLFFLNSQPEKDHWIESQLIILHSSLFENFQGKLQTPDLEK